jgi:hypothetical protein
VNRLLLYCEDRGQHSRCALGSLRQAGQILVFMPDENTRRTSAGVTLCETRRRADGGLTFLVRCPRCVSVRGSVREKAIRDDTALKLFAASFGELDISTV